MSNDLISIFFVISIILFYLLKNRSIFNVADYKHILIFLFSHKIWSEALSQIVSSRYSE